MLTNPSVSRSETLQSVQQRTAVPRSEKEVLVFNSKGLKAVPARSQTEDLSRVNHDTTGAGCWGQQQTHQDQLSLGRGGSPLALPKTPQKGGLDGEKKKNVQKSRFALSSFLQKSCIRKGLFLFAHWVAI